MKWLCITFKCDVPHLTVCTILYVSFCLNTSVTCASPHLICHNIFFLFSDVVRSAIDAKGEKVKRGERDVKLHYGYYAVAGYLPAAGCFGACAFGS